MLRPEFQIVIILGHLALVLMLPSLSGIGSGVVLTPGNFQAYPELLFSFHTQAPGSCVLGCKHQESRKIVSVRLRGKMVDKTMTNRS